MPIGALRGDIEQLPGLTGRAAKVAVVEDDGVVSGGCEALAEAGPSDLDSLDAHARVEPHLTDTAQAMAEHDGCTESAWSTRAVDAPGPRLSDASYSHAAQVSVPLGKVTSRRDGCEDLGAMSSE